jgi:hypothetical protein
MMAAASGNVCSVSQGAAVPAALPLPNFFAPTSKQLLHLKRATLDFMPVVVVIVDCFVAAAAASLGTVIGYAMQHLGSGSSYTTKKALKKYTFQKP